MSSYVTKFDNFFAHFFKNFQQNLVDFQLKSHESGMNPGIQILKKWFESIPNPWKWDSNPNPPIPNHDSDSALLPKVKNLGTHVQCRSRAGENKVVGKEREWDNHIFNLAKIKLKTFQMKIKTLGYIKLGFSSQFCYI